MSRGVRYRLDDLRRLVRDLLQNAGVAGSQASAFSRLLLWYSAVDAHPAGIESLPEWLNHLDQQKFDPSDFGEVGEEHASTATLKAGRGFPPLLLARAGELASQKARDAGTGLIRIVGLPESPIPLAATAADLAIGPYLGLILGSGSTKTLALPASEGVPVVYDSSIDSSNGLEGSEDASDLLSPWTLMKDSTDVVVFGVAIAAFESLGAFQHRIRSAINGQTRSSSGWIFPSTVTDHRDTSRVQGMTLSDATEAVLRQRAENVGIVFPKEINPQA